MHAHLLCGSLIHRWLFQPGQLRPPGGQLEMLRAVLVVTSGEG